MKSLISFFASRIVMVAVTLISALCFFTSPAFSVPIILQETLHFCDDRSPNSIGTSPGRRVTFGGNFTPDGDLDGDGFADSDRTSPPSTAVASQDGVVRVLNFRPKVNEPNHFVRSRAFDCDNPGNPDLRDSWTIDISNGNDTLMTMTADIPEGVRHMSFVTSMGLTGSGTTPTFNWTLPAGSTHDRVKISIRDLEDFIGQGGAGGGGAASPLFPVLLCFNNLARLLPTGIGFAQ